MAAAAVAGRAAAALLVLQRVRVAHAAAAVRVVVVRAGVVAAVLVPDLQCAACAACSQPDQSGWAWMCGRPRPVLDALVLRPCWCCNAYV